LKFEGSIEFDASTHLTRLKQLSKGKRFCYGTGIYSSPDPDVAAQYATTFTYQGEEWQIMFQVPRLQCKLPAETPRELRDSVSFRGLG
jgi:hypothetical protein